MVLSCIVAVCCGVVCQSQWAKFYISYFTLCICTIWGIITHCYYKVTSQINTGVLFLEYLQDYQSQESENEATHLQQRESKNCQSYKNVSYTYNHTHTNFSLGSSYLTSEPCESPFLAFLYTGQKLALKNTNKNSNSFIVMWLQQMHFLRKTSQNCNTHYKTCNVLPVI